MTNTDDETAIAAIRTGVESAENAGDGNAAAALLTEDAVLMVPDLPVQEGKAACARFLRDIMEEQKNEFERRIAYTSAEVAVAGDMAFDRGTFSFTVAPRAGGDTVRVTGKYLWVLRRRGTQSWRIARLIVSRDGDEEDPTANSR